MNTLARLAFLAWVVAFPVVILAAEFIDYFGA